MRYVIVGAGAIGAAIGGLLAESGQQVVLVARGAHLDALRRDGLRLALPDRELRLRLPAVTLDELELITGDVLLLAVKSQHSDGVLASLAGRPIGPSTAGRLAPLFCLQNGISNEDNALRYFAQVHGVCVNMPATHIEPGRVVAEGSPLRGILQIGRFVTGLDEVDSQVGRDLTAANIATSLRDDVMPWKRAKLLRNLGNALQVLVGLDAENDRDGDQGGALAEVHTRMVQEGLDCFAAAGLEVIDEPRYAAELADRARPAAVAGHSRQGGSTWQSVQRDQGSVETDFLNGEIVRLGRRHGVVTPVNEAIQTQMWMLMRAGGRTPRLDPAALLR